MKTNSKYTINQTGGSENDFMFKHMILSSEQYRDIINNNIDIKKLAQKNNVDFISVLKNEKVDFLHVSSLNNEESIDKTGLKINDNDFIMDLGKGIYAIKDIKDIFYDGIDNLKTYIADSFEENELLVIKGYYAGEFLECIYGYQHEGYIVLLNNVPSSDIWDIYKEKVDEFLLRM